jgi:hypothetical protein
MNQIKQTLIERAKLKYGNITPVVFKESLEDCFTVELGFVWFWFNIDNNSTKVEREVL